MRSLPRSYLLPDLLAVCPLKGGINPHYKLAAAESRAWVDSFNLGIFHNNASAIIKRSSVELLACYTYPAVGYEEFRTCCDFLNLLFVVDEVSDDQNGRGARATGETFLRALRSPESSDDSVLARMTKEFRDRLSSQSKPNAIRRFLSHCETYILGVVREAELRERGEVLGVEDFQLLRRENSAVRVCFDLAECMGGIELPDEAFQDPAFSEIYFAAMDMVCWSNDVYSYNMEQAKGHTGNNIVTVLMKAYDVDLQTASNFVGVHFKELMDRFLNAQANLRSFDPQADATIAAYIESIGYWVRGNLDWSFQTERYFGPAVDEVKKTRRVIVRRSKSLPLSPERVIISSRL